jgi:hypothetical protein
VRHEKIPKKMKFIARLKPGTTRQTLEKISGLSILRFSSETERFPPRALIIIEGDTLDKLENHKDGELFEALESFTICFVTSD